MTTNIGGNLDLAVDRALYRFATMTIPAGYWPSGPWYHWVPVGTTGPDTVEFGLYVNPETATDPIRWVHLTDTQVHDGGYYPFDEDLMAINQLLDRPLFIFNTGDLVGSGSNTIHWNLYMDQLSVSELPVFHAVGNHDTLGTDSPLDLYELNVGPPYYSLEAGSWHFIVYNCENEEIATPRQDDWLDADIAQAPPASRLILFQHRTVKDTNYDKAQYWASLGIQAVFSGHWHCLEHTETPHGIVDYNQSQIRNGPFDGTPCVFGIVTCDDSGNISYEQRRLGVDHRSAITHPQAGSTVHGDSLLVLVQAYDTTFHVTGVAVEISGAGGSIPSTPLTPEGISLWRTRLDISSLDAGNYDVLASGTFEDGLGIDLATSFTRGADPAPVPDLGASWPMFRRSPEGLGFTSPTLRPPLHLAWITPLPGLIALSSPVVEWNRVYVGCRAESQLADAGILASNAETGQILWFTHIPGGVALAPAVVGNVVIATALRDSVFGLDAQTGQRLWSMFSHGKVYDLTAPVFQENDAWVGGEPWTYQIDWSTGYPDWGSDQLGVNFQPFIYSAPAVGTNYLYYGTFGLERITGNQGGFRIVDRATGDIVSPLDTGGFRSPICMGDTIFTVGDADYLIQKLSARDPLGNIHWTASLELGKGTGSPVLGHDILVAPGSDGTIEAFNATDGSHLWSHTVGPALYYMVPGPRGERDTRSTPAIADSVVYIGSLDGYLYALDLFSGAELWKYYLATPISSSAAISGNMLFVGASDGHLYAFAGTKGSSLSGVTSPPEAETVVSFASPTPNPGQSGTRFAWSISAPVHIKLQIFNLRGQLVTTLIDAMMEAGSHTTVWDGTDRKRRTVATGTYFVLLRTGTDHLIRKVVIIR
jgi:outer membrane protein assembly factor BamB